MQVNRYDRPAEAPIINTYVPINFNELYRIGAVQKEAVDKAADQFGNAITTFGQFKSPSAVDTQNYYNNSIGQLKDLIEEASTNPDAMKDAGFRSKLQSRINSLDYSKLSNYRQSAENLQMRLQNIAKMQAAGKYNTAWDRINTGNWDTDKGGIMNELAPTEYLNANELSNKYFDNLRPGSLGDVWKDGVKYNVTGNNMEDLLAVAKAHQNDLLNTPQGQEYYRQFLNQYGGDEEKAREAFTDMVAQSQIDRTLRPQLTPDPVFLKQLELSYRNRGNEPKVEQVLPTRLDFINTTIQRSTNAAIGTNEIQGYRNYMQSIADKYGKDDNVGKTASAALNKIDTYIREADQALSAYNQYVEAYRQTGNQEYLLAAREAEFAADDRKMKLQGLAQRTVMLDAFKNASGFDAFNKSKDKYNPRGYIAGVKKAIDSVKAQIPVGNTDALLTELRGLPDTITDENGVKQQGYQFADSKGFVLPETVFVAATKTSPREVKRRAGAWADDKFPLKELIESGNANGVIFIPDNGVLQVGLNKTLTGKIRIPKTEVQEKLGTGTWTENWAQGLSIMATPLTGRESTPGAVRKLFGGREVKQLVGENGVEYFEIDAVRKLPSEYTTPAYWQNVNQHYQQSEKYGGIGGASQASKAYGESARQTLGSQQ